MAKYFISILLAVATIVSFAASADYLPKPAEQLVRHTFYTLSYDEQYEQADWVYYVLTDSMVLNSGEDRTNRFVVDKLVKTGSAKTSDYTKSGYDRGHLCPAADMGFSPVAMNESFLMSNISPQVPEFNRGIWKELEAKVREWAKSKHRIQVVTGPVFRNIKGEIGASGVDVPGYFYKVIFDQESNPEIVAFVLPNAKSIRPLSDFAVSCDEVEKLTGIDFFSQLPDELETKLEAKVELAGWFDGYTKSEPLAENKVAEKTPAPESDFKFYVLLILVVLIAILYAAIKGKKRR